MVAVEVFVWQNLIAEDRLAGGFILRLLPADDRLGDLSFQESRDVLAMRYVFIVLHIMPVRPFNREDFISLGHRFLEQLGSVVLGFDGELEGLLLAVGFHPHAKGQIAFVKVLFLFYIRGGEGFLVRLGDDGGLVVLIGLPKDDADLVVGELFAPVDFDLLVGVTLAPTFGVTLLDPRAVGVGDTMPFVAKGFRFLLELLPGIDQHHAPFVVGRLVVS